MPSHVCGESACFHGAFARKSAAQTKAAQVKGKVIYRHMGRGGWRYVVITGKGN